MAKDDRAAVLAGVAQDAGLPLKVRPCLESILVELHGWEGTDIPVLCSKDGYVCVVGQDTICPPARSPPGQFSPSMRSHHSVLRVQHEGVLVVPLKEGTVQPQFL